MCRIQGYLEMSVRVQQPRLGIQHQVISQTVTAQRIDVDVEKVRDVNIILLTFFCV